MSDIAPLGRMLMVLGVVLLVVGALLTVGRGLRIPGDILIKRDTYVIYIPLVTGLLLSLILTLLLSVFFRR